MKREFIKNKGSRLLPNRGAMNDIKGSNQSILDYGKASPATAIEPNSLLMKLKIKKS